MSYYFALICSDQSHYKELMDRNRSVGLRVVVFLSNYHPSAHFQPAQAVSVVIHAVRFYLVSSVLEDKGCGVVL